MGEENILSNIWRINTEEGWERRTIEELENLYEESKITTVIRAQ